MQSHTCCIYLTVCFQMSPKMACLNRCKITLVAFVGIFSTVRFQMSSQMACLRRCKITLVAFVWLFSTVCFRMCPEISRMRGLIVTLPAFISIVYFVRIFHIVIICSCVIVANILFHHHHETSVVFDWIAVSNLPIFLIGCIKRESLISSNKIPKIANFVRNNFILLSQQWILPDFKDSNLW